MNFVGVSIITTLTWYSLDLSSMSLAPSETFLWKWTPRPRFFSKALKSSENANYYKIEKSLRFGCSLEDLVESAFIFRARTRKFGRFSYGLSLLDLDIGLRVRLGDPFSCRYGDMTRSKLHKESELWNHFLFSRDFYSYLQSQNRFS